ncbi:isocitrate lyase/phosphoenolpyruvate mutase family protein [Glaciibacter psychrotolerans]
MATFRQLHHLNSPLLLPNAWDVGSALAFTEAGYRAVGTTSFGIAASAGLPDGGRSSKAATLALVARMRPLHVHVTADIENGYSDDPAEVASFVAQLAALGVAGINIEDSVDGHLTDSAAVAATVAAVKRSSPDVFINARVDNLWFAQQATVDAVLLRARTYVDAGADGVFVPGLASPEDIRSITSGIGVPVNVLAHPTLTVAELGELGVRRVSSGSLPYRAAVDAAVHSVNALRDGRLVPMATSYWEMQARLESFRESVACANAETLSCLPGRYTVTLPVIDDDCQPST